MPVVATREDYFVVAMDLLGAEGHGALRLGRLCESLGVTTGSFYHYFGGIDGFVRELLEYWEVQQTQRIAALSLVPADPRERIRRMRELSLTVPHEAEAAIRAWANTNPEVAAMQQRVDAERHAVLRRVILGVVPDRRRADLLAVIGLSLLIGLQQWRTPVRKRELNRVLDEFQQLIERHAAEVGAPLDARAS